MIDRVEFTKVFARAIAEREGYFVTEEQAKQRKLRWPTLAQRNNNPGNLRMWKGFPRNGGYAAFPDAATGWAKLSKQISLDIDRGLTFRQFVYKYAPPEDKNETEAYLGFVLNKLQAAFPDASMGPDTVMRGLVK
jgi:hypothetical protein